MKPEELEANRKRNWPKGHQAQIDRDSLFAHIEAIEKKLAAEQMRRAELGAKSIRLEAENTKLRAVAEIVLELADTWTPERLLEAAKDAMGASHAP